MELCTKCVLPAYYPDSDMDEVGICKSCRGVNENRDTKNKKEFIDESDVAKCLSKYSNPNRKYDVLVPLSGGVDSCNVLITVIEKYNLKPLGFHNDHGYEDPHATENVRELCKKLDVDLVVCQQDISFMKKLWKYTIEANIPGLFNCYVCGNILYLNALEVADKYDIPIVINGYSKGQVLMLDSRENGLNYLDNIVSYYKKTGDNEFIDKFLSKYRILDKRIAYQSRADLEQKVDNGKILVLPFYIFEFYKTDKSVLLENIKHHIDWRPLEKSYPKRSTNCTMVFINTHMDIRKMGYSAYDFEYAELVRRGEMTREQALEDLKFEPNMKMLEYLANEILLDKKYLYEDQPFSSKCSNDEKSNKNLNISKVADSSIFEF